MNTAQQFAFASPCFIAEQTLTQAYEISPSDSYPWSARMTLNIGLE